jgi:ATP-dependent DNA helicase 2 subunit 2
VEYIPIAQPNAGTIAKIDALGASSVSGDRMSCPEFILIKEMTGLLAIDALVVGIETQARYLAKKATWTRKVVLVTDAESPIEIEDWEVTVKKMDSLNISLTVVYACPSGFLSVNLTNCTAESTSMTRNTRMRNLTRVISRSTQC